MSSILHTILILIGAYFLGSLPFGLWVGKIWAGVDVREHGSGNIGVSNVLRTIGTGAAIVVLFFDAGKGLVPVLIARQVLTNNETLWFVAGIVAIVGHTWPIFLNFKGGRGVATACGVLLGLSWQVLVILLSIWLATLVISRYISLASILAAVALPISMFIFRFPLNSILLALLLSVLVIYRHRPNIQRLLAGTEYQIGERARKR